jgi:hypothetical protein
VAALLAIGPSLPASALGEREDPSEQRTEAGFNWLDRVNVVRAAADLPPLVEEAAWSAGSRLHSRYMVKNNYLGHDEDGSNPWFTTEGRTAAQNGSAYTNDGYDENEERGLDALLTTPFHLIGVLDPRLTRTGFGWYRENKSAFQAGATLDVSRGLAAASERVSYPIMFPGDGQTMPYSRYYGTERPDPWTGCPDRGFEGAPIIVQLASVPRETSVTLTKDGQALERCVFDETTYQHPDAETQALGRAILGARHAITIMPRAPLTAGTYRVTLTSDGETYAWSFSGPRSSPEPAVPSVLASTDARPALAALSTEPVLPTEPSVCPTRPEAAVGVTRLDENRLQMTVVARGENHALRQLQFGAPGQSLENASVLLPGHPGPITGQVTLTLPPSTPQRTFVVQRIESTRPATVPITVTDSCGAWSTVIGGRHGDDLAVDAGSGQAD